ncbi:MAG: peptidoglycan DD-metalloendopeptidase family protein [Deltaproteobacteria bacterium]|jgi:hypothetical protein|nr:peptidoglycan DD-metalloendopeptidase family protein [Deltaproteobacteria bacterium]MBW2530161.1 peptidoglycan DD-metalloendopeptidase family protein [Deltaproteobacteria bacterium]
MGRRRVVGSIVRIVGCALLLAAGTLTASADAQPFSYLPPGDLIPGSGQGRVDWTVYAPNMRFPIELAPAFANSQVYMNGGSQGPGGGQCDSVNYSYPWRDNYCEIRSWTMPLCPAGQGHQGQDIRPATCANHAYWCVATTAGTITNVGTYSVYLTAADGTRYDYLHMSNVAVSVGQSVSRGQRLGMVSNQFGGTPTSIHLHFNIRQFVANLGNVYVPPYMSLVRSYEALIGPICECTVGAVESETCGNCGYRERVCGGNCLWGAWSPCQAEGPCSPGAVQTQSCCDCGQRSRTCRSDCQWDPFSACAGPDPGGGTQACATGRLGPCADGTMRCVDGCLQCASTYQPAPELCDDFDNDCSGAADDGFPAHMGGDPPAMAARLVDLSFPSRLGVGERGLAWAVFLNEGSMAWPERSMWLESTTARSGERSDLWNPTWPAWDVAAVVADRVEPGERATLRWTVRAPEERGRLSEQFRLTTDDRLDIMCPEPRVELSLRVGLLPSGETGEASSKPRLLASRGGCRFTPPSSGHPRGMPLIAVLGASGIVLRRRKRQSRSSRAPAQALGKPGEA